MKISGLTGVAVLLVAGCTFGPPKEKSTFNEINSELNEASEKRAVQAQQQSVVQSLLPPISADMPRAERVAPEQRFDLTVTNAPATQVLNAIVTESRYSIVVHPGIKDSISLTLKNVTLREVLNAVREIYGYDYRIDGNVIYVLPAVVQSRMFKVDYLAAQRRGSTDLRVSSNSIAATAGGGGASAGAAAPTQAGAASTSAGVGQSTQVTTLTAMSFWTELRETLGVFAGCKLIKEEDLACEGEGGRRVVVSPNSGTVLVRAMPSELNNVAAFLRASQASVEKQVLIEARILEVALSDGFETGINWAGFFTGSQGTIGVGMLTPGTRLGTTATGTIPQGGNSPNGAFQTPLTAGVTESNWPLGAGGRALEAASSAAGSIFGVAIQAKNFASLMSFLSSQGVVHTLSNPRIATLNNQKAVLKVGNDSLFVTRITGGSTQSTNIGTTPTVTSPTFEVQSFFSGIALDVTPRVGEDGSVVLHVRPSVSDVTQQNTTFNLGSLGIYIIPLVKNNISETDSVIRVQDGQIVAIGGLMKQVQTENRQGVPGLGDMPYLGAAFRNTKQGSEKRELVILLKPTVIQSGDSWAQNLLDARDRIKAMDRGFSWGGRAGVFGTEAEEQKQ